MVETEKTMSTFKVEVFKIEEIAVHPNAERLELAKIAGWQVVVGKGVFQVGDLALYLPVDSVLPASLENRLFPPTSKVKLRNSRIRSIKLRGQMSQGMVIPIVDMMDELRDQGKQDFLPTDD